MTKEQKELLMKDLCGRFPHKVKSKFPEKYDEEDYYVSSLEEIDIDGYCQDFEGVQYEISEIKPYLFPLSSMTKKQRDEFYNMIHPVILEGFEEDETLDYDRDNENRPITQKLVAPDVVGLDWLNANHFDYRGLIEQGLAIDATGLGIYKEQTE